ncbi:MAG: hypothetical protein ACI4DV_00275 [Lachnospiraceae bacterium]
MMYSYSLSQWVLFFFWYCFIGWIWESCYVSVRKAISTKKWEWVNRGFVHGPILPIYGFAATVILISTITVRDDLLKIYLFGMAAVTLMELVTGTVMEKLFGVKYWDYSDIPLNYHGHICLFVSLFWGCCALLLVKVIHMPVESVVLKCPEAAAEWIAMILVGIGVYDFSESFREAMDMKELLEKITETKESIRRLERRFDAVVAFTPVPDMEHIFEKRGNLKQTVNYNLEKLRTYRVEKLRSLRDYLQQPELEEDRESLREQIEQQLQHIFSRSNKQYQRSARLLRRNPYAISNKYADALKEIRELFEEKKKDH